MNKFNVVKKTVSDCFNIRPGVINKTTHLENDLELDSLDRVILQAKIESKCKNFYPNVKNWVENVQTVGDIADYVDMCNHVNCKKFGLIGRIGRFGKSR